MLFTGLTFLVLHSLASQLSSLSIPLPSYLFLPGKAIALIPLSKHQAAK